MKLFPRIYLLIITTLLGSFLIIRVEDIFTGKVSLVDTLVCTVFIALVLLPVFKEVTLGGVTLKSKIEAMVQSEVGKAQLEALQLSSQRDLLMMPIWEKENSSIPSNFSSEKVELVEQKVSELEGLWLNSSPEEKVHYGLALRELYWEYLKAARHHWASSEDFQQVWRRVEKGFASLGNVNHVPSR